jgi:hypothetical protein
MAGRPKGGRSTGAKRTTIYLNPIEDLALSVLENSRRVRGEKRCQPSDIIADAIWVYLERAEGKTRKQVEALLPATPGKQQPATNVTEITKKKNGE